MKRTLSLVVCSFLSVAVLGAGAPHDINGANVTSVAVDTLNNRATASLFIYELPSGNSKPRAWSGDGPMPISPRHAGEHTITLDLANDNEQLTYRLLLAARASDLAVDLTFSKTGAVSGVAIHRGRFMPTSEGHLNPGDMKNVMVEGVHYCLVKNAIRIDVSAFGNGGACAMPNARCSRPELSVSLDPSNVGDARSFEALLSAYVNSSVVDLGFDPKGELTNVTLHAGYAARPQSVTP